MNRRDEDRRSRAVVERKRPLISLRQRGYLLRLGNAAAPGQIEHDDRDGAGCEQIAELIARALGFTSTDRNAGRTRIFGQCRHVIHFDQVFRPVRIIWLQRFGDANGGTSNSASSDACIRSSFDGKVPLDCSSFIRSFLPWTKMV